MNSINFIKDIWYDGPDRAMYTHARSGRASKLFIRQGDLDSSCAVYSLMMVLMILRKVNYSEMYSREEAQNLTEGGYNSVMRLQDHFLRNLKGCYRDDEYGYEFSQLEAELKSCFGKEVKTSSYDARRAKSNSPRKKELMELIKNALDNNLPVEIGFTFDRNTGGHAVVVVGYTFHKGFLRLFCLDPSFDLQKTAFWNSIVDIKYNATDAHIYRDWYINPEDSQLVSVDELLIIE